MILLLQGLVHEVQSGGVPFWYNAGVPFWYKAAALRISCKAEAFHFAAKRWLSFLVQSGGVPFGYNAAALRISCKAEAFHFGAKRWRSLLVQTLAFHFGTKRRRSDQSKPEIDCGPRLVRVLFSFSNH